MKADSSAVPSEQADDMDETASESLDGGEPAGKVKLWYSIEFLKDF